jgi:hypothetical protein
MEAKPFSLQSPEKVAEAYGGNKQKIAQAIQMGVVDPTSGLLAGMFIDRMRSAQMMEQAPQQTVAQQVFTPPAPPAPPAGLGAVAPQGGGMPAPPPPQAPMGAPPVGMAAGGMTELPVPNDPYNTNSGGGLTTLPLPDNMYDEQSFAGGGIVAFSGGGDSKTERLRALMASVQNPAYSFAERRAMMEEINRLTGTVRQERKPTSTLLGKSFADIDAASRAANKASGQVPFFEGMSGQVNPDIFNYVAEQDIKNSAMRDAVTAGSTSAPPTARTPAPLMLPPGQGVLASAPAASPAAVPSAPPRPRAPASAPAAPAASDAGSTQNAFDYIAALKPTTVGTPEEEAAKIEKYIGEPPKMALRTAEEKADQKNQDLWSALAQIGFGMAAGESPNALVNISKAASAAIPGIQEAIKQRRADDKEDLKQQLTYEMSKWGMKKDAYLEAVKRIDDMTKNELSKATTLAQIVSREKESAADRVVQLRGQANNMAVAKLYANKDQQQIANLAAVIKRRNPELSDAEAEYQAYNRVLSGAGSFAARPTTYNQARAQALREAKDEFKFDAIPAGWIDTRAREILNAAGGGEGGGYGGGGGGFDPTLWGKPQKVGG